MVRESYEQFVADRDEDTFGGDVVAVANPATTIVLAYLAVTLVVGGLVGAVLYQNPTLFGENGYARIAGIVVLAVTVVGALRLAIKYVVLLRTKYVVSDDSVRREYSLAYREESRELPLHMIRGVETSKSRLQALLGYATISFLAVGSNRGIGYVEFDNTADPEELQQAVLELLDEQRARAEDDSEPSPASPSTGSAAATRTTTDATEDQATADAAAADATNAKPGANADESLAGSDDDPLAGDDENARRPVSGNDDAGRQPDADRSADADR